MSCEKNYFRTNGMIDFEKKKYLDNAKHSIKYMDIRVCCFEKILIRSGKL